MSANGCEDLDCGPRDPDDPYSISCGQHYCNSAFTGQTCADDLGKNPACLSSCSTQEVNYDEGYWRTAPGMFNDPLARQDICRYRGLQNVLPTLQRFDNDLGQQTVFGRTWAPRTASLTCGPAGHASGLRVGRWTRRAYRSTRVSVPGTRRRRPAPRSWP